MKKYTYDEIKSHIDGVTETIEQRIFSLEKCVIQARDSEEINLPIYSTKWRIKTPSSIFLKTKRKNYESLDEITDYGGMRILCLFEQDILITHKFIIDSLQNNNFSLFEFSTFNWDDASRRDLERAVGEADSAKIIESLSTNKDSGYRSVHYILKSTDLVKPFYIELQLRTLFQDVWSELEHSLSYKQGSIHPHIKESFVLLSKELEAKDGLISHLKDISDKEKVSTIYRSRKTGPFEIFSYGAELLSEKLSENNECQNAKNSYEEFVFQSRGKDSEEWVNVALNLLEEFRTCLYKNYSPKEVEDDKRIIYWLEMEKGFLEFHNQDLDSAEKTYRAITKISEKERIVSHITYFRFGEVLFRQGKTVQALVCFDKSETICDKKIGKDKNPNELKDIYRIKTKLANIYWILGEEFYDIAWEEIKHAEEIFNSIKQHFDEPEIEEASLINNLCWYSLDNSIAKSKQDKKDDAISFYAIAKKYFQGLETGLNEDSTANSYDTAAWFCFQSYIFQRNRDKERAEGKAIEYLKKADQYCDLILKKRSSNRATASFLSFSVQKNHFEEIKHAMTTYLTNP